MGDVNRDMETLRNYQKVILEIKIEMKKAFDGLINRLNMAKERISDLKDRTRKTSQINNRYEITDPGSLENTKRINTNPSHTLVYYIQVTENPKQREKF